MFSWYGDTRMLDAMPGVLMPGLPIVVAASTAARASSRPAPCSSAGMPRSWLVVMRICLTSAGVGEAPWCALRYAWMTSAAAPAVSGADWLVPPNGWIGVGWPLNPLQPLNCADVEHNAQSASPGATRSMVRPPCVKPAEDRAEMLLSAQVPLLNRNAA